jgi:hypothetical protein
MYVNIVTLCSEGLEGVYLLLRELFPTHGAVGLARFEPAENAVCVEIVAGVAWEHCDFVVWLEFFEVNYALSLLIMDVRIEGTSYDLIYD